MRSKETELNNAAFRRLEDEIKRNYPHGQFVAFVGGEIVADAADFDELAAKLKAAGKDHRKAFIVQAGHHYPEYAVIFCNG
ncbi:MAG: hypothetical protein HYR84_13235 [Planctomycetes bacterium]|nr:hypothetical protein [Planctomycetota bacterium]